MVKYVRKVVDIKILWKERKNCVKKDEELYGKI